MLSERLKKVEEKIYAACKRAGRKREEITLVAVTKTIGTEQINEAITLGIHNIGENRVQEYVSKKNALLPHLFHLVGHLQTNKVKQIIGDVHLIHSVDSIHLAEEIDKQAERIEKKINILLEVNASNEISKYGIHPDHILEITEKVLKFQFLSVEGFMTVAAFEFDPMKVRPSFILMKNLKEKISTRVNKHFEHLSMGMSNDYEIAIEEGATIIRVGSAIFGPRIN